MNLEQFTPPSTPQERDAFNDGMAAPMSAYDSYLMGRNFAPVRQSPPQQAEVAPHEERSATAVIFEAAKPMAALAGLGTAVVGVGWIVWVAARAVAVAVVAFVEANALAVGGGVLLAIVAVGGISALMGGKSDNQQQQSNQPKGVRFYQRQEQGWEEF